LNIKKLGNPEIVLSLQADKSGTIENPQYQSNVVAYPRQPGAQLFQLWTATNDGQIINEYNYDALAINSTALKSAVVTNKGALGIDIIVSAG
jgi:hypothetical protein